MEIDAKQVSQALAKHYFKPSLVEETDQESWQTAKLKTTVLSVIYVGSSPTVHNPFFHKLCGQNKLTRCFYSGVMSVSSK